MNLAQGREQKQQFNCAAAKVQEQKMKNSNEVVRWELKTMLPVVPMPLLLLPVQKKKSKI